MLARVKLEDEGISRHGRNYNYKKSCYMIISNKIIKSTCFKLTINHNAIEKSDNVKYLSVHFDNKLTWEKHINTMSKKLSKICEMIYKLRHYVSLSTLKLIILACFTLKFNTLYSTGVELLKTTCVN